jgi:hypothetical protein
MSTRLSPIWKHGKRGFDPPVEILTLRLPVARAATTEMAQLFYDKARSIEAPS